MNKEALELAKRIAHEVWEKYDDTHGYRAEKQERNAKTSTDDPYSIWFFWQQFDMNNQAEFFILLSTKYQGQEGFDDLFDWIFKEGGMQSR